MALESSLTRECCDGQQTNSQDSKSKGPVNPPSLVSNDEPCLLGDSGGNYVPEPYETAVEEKPLIHPAIVTKYAPNLISSADAMKTGADHIHPTTSRIILELMRKEIRMYRNFRAGFLLFKSTFFAEDGERFDVGWVDFTLDWGTNEETKLVLSRPGVQGILVSEVNIKTNSTLSIKVGTPDIFPLKAEGAASHSWGKTIGTKGWIKVQSYGSEQFRTWQLSEDKYSEQGIPMAMSIAVVVRLEEDKPIVASIAGKGHVKRAFFKPDFMTWTSERIKVEQKDLVPIDLEDKEVEMAAGFEGVLA